MLVTAFCYINVYFNIYRLDWQLKRERSINTAIDIIVPTDKSSNVYVINPSSTEYHRLMTKSTQHCQSWYEAAVQRTPEARPGKKMFILSKLRSLLRNGKFSLYANVSLRHHGSFAAHSSFYRHQWHQLFRGPTKTWLEHGNGWNILWWWWKMPPSLQRI